MARDELGFGSIKELDSLYAKKRGQYADQIQPETNEAFKKKLLHAVRSTDFCMFTWRDFEKALTTRHIQEQMHSLEQQQLNLEQQQLNLEEMQASLEESRREILKLAETNPSPELVEAMEAHIRVLQIAISFDEADRKGSDSASEIYWTVIRLYVSTIGSSLRQLLSSSDARVAVAVNMAAFEALVGLIPPFSAIFGVISVLKAFRERQRRRNIANDELNEIDAFIYSCDYWCLLTQIFIDASEGELKEIQSVEELPSDYLEQVSKRVTERFKVMLDSLEESVDAKLTPPSRELE